MVIWMENFLVFADFLYMCLMGEREREKNKPGSGRE
jgi:hypothetical protein